MGSRVFISITLAMALCGAQRAAQAEIPGDVNLDGRLDAVDVQLVINAALAIPTGVNGDVNRDGSVDAIDVQLAINAVLGFDIGAYVPSLTGLARAAAEAAILAANLVVGAVDEAYTAGGAAGAVFDQSPEAGGGLVPRATPVNFTLSLGPPSGPVPVITIQEGHRATPQTLLHLDGAASYATTGAITAYKWEVIQPEGSQSVFAPSDSVATPTFEANTAGTYTFLLTVWDASTPCATPATYQVQIVPEVAVHVELLWHTPGDPDETDTGASAGSDIDIHFCHSDGPANAAAPDLDGDGSPDPYFDQPYDCLWFNPHPEWGVPGYTADNPSLDRDDVDGAGPENVNLAAMQDGKDYLVSVHYWASHGFGDALATVRIYIQGQLVFEDADVTLQEHDMWRVAWIHGAAGTVTSARIEGDPYITPDYCPPDFCAP